MNRSNAEFRRWARARLKRWVKRQGYLEPEFSVELQVNGAGGARVLRAVVRKAGEAEVWDVFQVEDYPGEEICLAWAEEARP